MGVAAGERDQSEDREENEFERPLLGDHRLASGPLGPMGLLHLLGPSRHFGAAVELGLRRSDVPADQKSKSQFMVVRPFVSKGRARLLADDPLVADVRALIAEVVAIGVISRLVDPAPVIGRAGREGTDRHAADERRTPPALVPIAAMQVAPMPSPVALMPSINGGASPSDAGRSHPAYAVMPCAETAAGLGADAWAPKCAEVAAVLDAHGRAVKAADASATECTRTAARDGHAEAMKRPEVAAVLDAHGRAVKAADASATECTRTAARDGHAEAMKRPEVAAVLDAHGRAVKAADASATECTRTAGWWGTVKAAEASAGPRAHAAEATRTSGGRSGDRRDSNGHHREARETGSDCLGNRVTHNPS